MYLSSLMINVGENPDRPRPGRLWLRNVYHVHQRLCMAFPSAEKTTKDVDFLMPYNPGDFDSEQVHVDRSLDSGFLFRVDPQLGGRAIILVQSAMEPNWGYAFRNADYLLAAPWQVKEFQPQFADGQTFRFRLVANPTRKIDTKSGADGRRRNGRRVPVPGDQLMEWLIRKGESAGFSLVADSTIIRRGYVYVNKREEGNGGQQLRSVRYDGLLKITDADAFQQPLIRGIGAGKAFGFGLLSVAAVRNSALEEE